MFAARNMLLTRPVTEFAKPTIVGSDIGTTTANMPVGLQVGDDIYVCSYRTGNAVTPTAPTPGGTVPTYVDVLANAGTNLNAMRVVHFVATATTHTVGTWTGSDRTSVIVIRGQKSGSAVGAAAEQGGATASVDAPALTLTNTDGTSLVLHWHCAKILPSGGWGSPNAGYTQQQAAFTNVNSGMMLNTKDVTTLAPAVSQAIVSTNGWRAASVEVLAH